MTDRTDPSPTIRHDGPAAGTPNARVGDIVDTRRGSTDADRGHAEDGGANVSLCEALDRMLHKGAVLKGEVTISVANVDLVYLGFQVLLASVDTARSFMGSMVPMRSAAEPPTPPVHTETPP